MHINFINPSAAEADLVHDIDGDIPLTITPKRWADKQQALTVIPVESVNANGVILDAGVLTVNQRTGKLTLTKVSTEAIDCEADKLTKKDLYSEDQKNA